MLIVFHVSEWLYSSITTPQRSPGKIYSCIHCNYRTLRSDNFKTHMSRHLVLTLRSAIQSPRKYHCPFCSYVAIRAGHLSVHLSRHMGNKPFTCKYCPKRFASKSDRNRHLLVHVKIAS
ncbi:hypothetical protein JTE90_007925 [Oedothorax gibbosus]|uniref:C2H2-type domain-containing protein n=1 Tax=Oedothorax gibbosus TaxID=931172 RepID=A0AAV6VHG4_9ARAC|nr:hypothetical protein JTE90_007925 [Oedothorax gibbosus]